MLFRKKKEKNVPDAGGIPKKEGVRFKKGRFLYAVPLFAIFGILFLGASQSAVPDRVSREAIGSESIASSGKAENVTAELSGEGGYEFESEYEYEYTAKLFGVLPTKTVKSVPNLEKKLVPCGDVFGVKFFTKGVVVTAVSEVESTEGIISPAAKAGLKAGDILLSVDGKEINTAEELGEAVRKSEGKS